jgi:hypothetical protein
MKKNLLPFLTLFFALVFSLPLHSQTFTLQADSVISIEWQTGLVPAITDLNMDGLLDVYVGAYFGDLHYWEQTNHYSNSFQSAGDTLNVGMDTNFPAFADLDGDGLIDLLIGSGSGEIAHYEQSAPKSLNFQLQTSNFCSIDVGHLAAPTLTDFNGDGMLDLIVGGWMCAQHFRQQSPNSLTFVLSMHNFFGILLKRRLLGQHLPTLMEMDYWICLLPMDPVGYTVMNKRMQIQMNFNT